jgi:hypothetical protein
MASFFSGQSDWAVHGAGLFIDGKFAPRVNSPLSVLSKPQAASPRCVSASGREPSPVTLEEPAGSRNAQRRGGHGDAVPSEIYANYRGTHAGPFNDLRQRHIFGALRLPVVSASRQSRPTRPVQQTKSTLLETIIHREICG